jgi:hypothetical protein
LYGARIIRKFDVVEGGKLRNAVLYAEWQDARTIFENRGKSLEKINASRKRNNPDTTPQPSGDEDVTEPQPNGATGTLTGTETVTKTEEQEQEPLSIPSTAAAVKSAEVVTIWNELTQGKLPHAKSSLNRQKVIQTRLKEPGWLPDFRAACAYLAETPWYTGHNDRQWVATIDFALQAGKATELAEKATQQAPQSVGALNHGNVQHHRTATDQRYIDQLAARDERRAREATEHPEAALPVLQ